MPELHTEHHAALATLLETIRPASLLLIDPNPEPLSAACRQALPADCRIEHLPQATPERLAQLGQFDLGVVANTLEHLEPRQAGILLSRLRDVHTRRFVALLPLGEDWPGLISHWQVADLLGYGMSLLARYRSDGRPLGLFHYAIVSYKTTPDWFNSKYWAHPERWKP
ncbi:MAG TPA: DUF6231 family protein [Candidatus Competibacteraceae bacterium]|nr:DUF6231 family protein [Candidatus Competibacteraceae bacterium]